MISLGGMHPLVAEGLFAFHSRCDDIDEPDGTELKPPSSPQTAEEISVLQEWTKIEKALPTISGRLVFSLSPGLINIMKYIPGAG